MKLYRDDFSELENAVNWCNEYIKAYQKIGDFDPFKALSGENDKKDKLYIECVNFLYELETLTDNFKDIRKKFL
jgi:hypothetical protein